VVAAAVAAAAGVEAGAATAEIWERAENEPQRAAAWQPGRPSLSVQGGAPAAVKTRVGGAQEVCITGQTHLLNQHILYCSLRCSASAFR
jgi:hypothetical protein